MFTIGCARCARRLRGLGGGLPRRAHRLRKRAVVILIRLGAVRLQLREQLLLRSSDSPEGLVRHLPHRTGRIGRVSLRNVDAALAELVGVDQYAVRHERLVDLLLRERLGLGRQVEDLACRAAL